MALTLPRNARLNAHRFSTVDAKDRLEVLSPPFIQTVTCRGEYGGNAEQTGGLRRARIAANATKMHDGLA